MLGNMHSIIALLFNEAAQECFQRLREASSPKAQAEREALLKKEQNKIIAAIDSLHEKMTAEAFEMLLGNLRDLNELFRREANKLEEVSEESASGPSEEGWAQEQEGEPVPAASEPEKVVKLFPEKAEQETPPQNIGPIQKVQEQKMRREIASFFQELTDALLEKLEPQKS